MTKYIIFIFFCSFLTTFGQVSTIKIEKQKFISSTFPGGKDSLQKYLDKNVNEVISSDRNLQRRIKRSTEVEASVILTSNGEVEKVELVKSSFDSNIDTLFIKSISEMPTWIPATDELGNNCSDKQMIRYTLKANTQFRISVGQGIIIDTTDFNKTYNKKNRNYKTGRH